MKDNKIGKALLLMGDYSYALAWQFVKLAIIGPIVLGLIFVFMGIGEDTFIKVAFIFPVFPMVCFFIAGLSGIIGNISAEKSQKHLYGNVFTNIFLTIFGGYGSVSIVYVLITRLF